MCTLLLMRDVVPGVPVVLAANRDEFLARPWDPPKVDMGGPGQLARLYPTDREAGGTWVGLNGAGVGLAVTNRVHVAREDSRRSRGLLALDALAALSREAAVSAVSAELEREPYNGINILVFDADGATVITYGGEELTVSELESGVHVVTSSHDLDPEMLSPLRDRVASLGRELAIQDLAQFRSILADTHRYPDGYSVCKHLGGYGTVSASIVAVGADSGSRFLFAPGAPDAFGFAPVDQGGLARSS